VGVKVGCLKMMGKWIGPWVFVAVGVLVAVAVGVSVSTPAKDGWLGVELSVARTRVTAIARSAATLRMNPPPAI